jgi:hypothetical protein
MEAIQLLPTFISFLEDKAQGMRRRGITSAV